METIGQLHDKIDTLTVEQLRGALKSMVSIMYEKGDGSLDWERPHNHQAEVVSYLGTYVVEDYITND